MKKGLKSFYAQVGIGTDLFYKFQLLFLFLFSAISLSAQEVSPDLSSKPQATITVVGDAFIYSKDKNFNEQVTKNKELQKNAKIEIGKNNEVKITGKKKNKALSFNNKKTENIVLASKKSYKDKANDAPKKEIYFHLKGLDDDNQFFAGSKFGKVSFISPNNDPPSGKYLFVLTRRPESVTLAFLYVVIYFYDNDNSNLQVFHNDFSVRPPPSLI